MYTYGQMRTGNEIYASFVNKLFGDNAFRSMYWISIPIYKVMLILLVVGTHTDDPLALFLTRLKTCANLLTQTTTIKSCRFQTSWYVSCQAHLCSKLYWHPLIGVEYWQNPDPSSPATVKKCAPDGEDPTCSDSIPDKVIQSKTTLEAHLYVSFFFKESHPGS